jgi:Rieske Fe-S protein
MRGNLTISRREFLLLAAGLAAGCGTVGNDASSAAGKTHAVNAGPASHYANDGVYNNFRDLGFFVIRRGDSLFALSAICTHRKCTVTAEPDRSFYCKCHGSTFDPAGHVTEGPARRDLPVLPSFINEQGQLIVTVAAV